MNNDSVEMKEEDWMIYPGRKLNHFEHKWISPKKSGEKGYYKKVPKGKVTFLKWGTDSNSDDQGSYTIAIVIKKNGFLLTVHPSSLCIISDSQEEPLLSEINP